MENKLALAMILKASKDEVRYFEKCMESIAPYVDGVFVNMNHPTHVPKQLKIEVEKILGKYKNIQTEIQTSKWENNFVKAREDSFAQVPKGYDFIMWLDADDEVINPEKIKEVLAIWPASYSGLYVDYKYDHDQYGNVTVNHWVARIVRNNGTYHWKSSFDSTEATVHETLVEKRMVTNFKNDEFWVKHHSTNERRDASLARNIGLLEKMYQANEKNPDPRIVFYLATHYLDAGMGTKAKPLFDRYLTMSGWAEERSQAMVYLGDIYKGYGKTNQAREYYIRALAENPNDPSPYVELGELELQNQLWQKAISWLEMATNKEVDNTTIVQRPMEATYRAYKLLSEAYVNLSAEGLEPALKWLKKALKLRPTEPELLAAKERLEEMQRIKELNSSALVLARELQQTKELDKLIPFVDSLPKDLQDSPLAQQIRNIFDEPKYWDKKTIAIFVGPSALGEWGPWSLEKGIGGSEEAVIHLSQQLTALGWAVTVYATPGEKAGDYSGVQWKHYWEFNNRDTFDVLIGWRAPSFFDKAFKARKRYLWLHDVIDAPELTPERLMNIEKIIFVSQYHRDLYPDVPDDKCFVSGNGIDPEVFEEVDGKFERDNKRVVYMSAHERGQDMLYRVWPKVKEAVPDATLDCYYGWEGYDHINRNNPERMAWKQQLIDTEKTLEDVRDHGRIGHEQIVEEVAKAGVWAYPTTFPEVYCITGAKIQAGGAWPVTTDYAALKEIVKYGDKIHVEEADPKSHVGQWTEKALSEFADKLIDRLKNPPTEKERMAMQTWARNNLSWQSTARGWHEEFSA